MTPIRVLPLGGLGEIGKNMTVFEIEDRLLVVDVGLRFPTAEMLGICTKTLYNRLREYGIREEHARAPVTEVARSTAVGDVSRAP